MIKLPRIPKELKLALLAGAFLAGSAALLLGAETSENWDARLVAAYGDVKVFTQGGEAEGLPAEKDMPLEDGDRITTGEGASAEIALSATSLIHLASNSDFKVTNLRRSETDFQLLLGTFLAKIRGLGASQNLQVRTPTAVAAVRGTEFGVEVDAQKPDETHVGVFDEGKVVVKGQSGGSETVIANQETKVSKGAAPLAPYQLKRFMRHRQFVRGLGRKISALRKTWRPLTAAERQEKRRKAHERGLKRRQQAKEKTEQSRKKKKPRTEDDHGRKKMEKFREEIRRRHKHE